MHERAKRFFLSAHLFGQAVNGNVIFDSLNLSAVISQGVKGRKWEAICQQTIILVRNFLYVSQITEAETVLSFSSH